MILFDAKGNPMTDRDMTQTITLVTADGRRLTYTGRVQFDPDDPPKVVDIIAGVPRPLPEGCAWEGVPARSATITEKDEK